MNRRDVVLIFAVLVLIVTTLVAMEHWQTNKSLSIKRSARAADLEQRFTQSSVLPSLLAKDPRVINALSFDSEEHINDVNELLKFSVENSEVAIAFLMNSSGLTVASSNFSDDVSFVGNNYGFRPYFVNAMKGERATFFAVGATTGIPGYFISEPVISTSATKGVLVVKLEPRELPLSWTEDDTFTVVSDELGVPILSTETSLLYQPTRELSALELSQISAEKRYQLTGANRLTAVSPKKWRFNTDSKNVTYIASSQLLSIEPWTLTVLTRPHDILNRSLRNIAAVLGVTTIAALLLHAYQQQKLVATERGKTAELLEQLVEDKTRELKKAQNALIAESNFSMLGKMSAAINHEINQPLASMRFDLATLRQIITRENSVSIKENKGDYDAKAVVVNLDRTAKRISRVIETLRVLPQQQKSDFTPVNMYMVLKQSIDTVKADRKQMSQYLSVDLNDLQTHRRFVHGNSVLLMQAVLNLLYNALDALVNTEGAPYADVGVHVRDKSLSIDVRDSGAGIDPLVASVLFEPFESSSTKSEGLGLGLTLARQIVSLHGGTIVCARIDINEDLLESRQLTVFTITLPLVEESL